MINYSDEIRRGDLESFSHRFDEARDRLGEAGVKAFEKLFDFYGKDWIDWLASLYDRERGAFYYADSARDNPGFLPDAESTAQALNIIKYSGMLRFASDSYLKSYPDGMRERLVSFIRGMQSEEDGYFYHEQWGRNIGSSRRGRDYSQCLELLRKFGSAPLYPTAEERLKEISESEVKARESVMPKHLLSREAMLEYLDGLNVNKSSHSAGHILSSQGQEIKAAGLSELVLDYVGKLQNTETGLWEEEANYSSMSGVIKISALYSRLGEKIKHGERIVKSAIDVILSDIDPTVVIYVFNPWGALGTARSSAKAGYESAIREGRKPDFDLALIDRMIRDAFPAMIDKTIEKLKKFRKPDGSFSYEQKRSSPTTQGVPVSLGEYEGDVNGLACAMQYTLGGIFGAVGISRIPAATGDDFMRFIRQMELRKQNTESNK